MALLRTTALGKKGTKSFLGFGDAPAEEPEASTALSGTGKPMGF